MFMRRRPLLRTAVIGGGAYVAGKKSAQRSAEQAQQQDQAQQTKDEQNNKDEQNKDEQNERIVSPQQQKGPGSAAPKPTMLDQLHQLNTLHQQGALTDTEFTAAKSKLLGSG
jgi:hypothetical protein